MIFCLYLQRVNDLSMVVLEAILVFYLLFCVAGMFIKAVPVILLLPVAPFKCAAEIKAKQPFTAWLIIALYALLYTAAVVTLIVAALS